MKLGFVAMSGLRAHNEELTQMGLTLPGFVERSKIIVSLPSLGLLTLAGMTPDTIDVDYVEVADLNALDGLPGEYDVVAISSYTAQIKDAYRLADRYRVAGTLVILGGSHVSALPAESALHADSIVIGEGEPSWPQLISDLVHGRLKPAYDSRGCNFNLAHSPMPRFELLNPEQYNRITVQTQRGCPHNCEFCAATVRMSPTYKVKPVGRVIAEIRRIKEIWSRPFIEFADDNSFVNKKHTKRLLRALAEENVRWFAEADVSVADDDEVLRLMRASGCAQVLIGLESPSPEGLNGLEINANWKARQLDTYRDAIAKIQGHGISVNGCFVLGLDGTGPESFDDVFEFVRDSNLDEVQITVLTVFPGTPLFERLMAEGRIVHENAWELCTLFDVNYIPQNMSVRELEVNFRNLAERLYAADFNSERKRKYKERLREVIRRERRTGKVPIHED